MITESDLDSWVRGHPRDAQGLIVELIWRLVAASCPHPKERRFPLGDSIEQHGADGELDTDLPFLPFVPEGRSYWEIGTGDSARAKATKDYRDLTKAVPKNVRTQSSFVFVTPHSGRRDWPATWKRNQQKAWLERRRERDEWKSVEILDGTKLIDWLKKFPAIEAWLLYRMPKHAVGIESPVSHWNLVRSFGAPHFLKPEIFLLGRDAARIALADRFGQNSNPLKIATHSPRQVNDFVAAHIASLDSDRQVEASGRCLFVFNEDGWRYATDTIVAPHVLVADPRLDLDGDEGTLLIQRARQTGHAVVYGGLPGGNVLNPNSVPLPNPKNYELQKALETCGFSGERSRILAGHSDGNLTNLRRIIQNLSTSPEWAQTSDAADLAIAALIGSWQENNEADRLEVERLVGKGYGEWIAAIRRLSLVADTPLIHKNGTWKIIARTETWRILGPHIHDEHLDRFRDLALKVLREIDPAFDLPAADRYAAQVHGKVLLYSKKLRHGIAEALALLGCFPSALVSCTNGKPEGISRSIVRELLGNANGFLWGSLDHLLPILAESSPQEFLRAIERSVLAPECPFDELFRQESSDFGGRNYMSGLLWGLETLAWSAEYLPRVTLCLGELDKRDPGGNWANRPLNSLRSIFLPWHPQTAASIAVRVRAIESLLREAPDTAWRLLLQLLPAHHSTAFGTRRPTWQAFIPEDWKEGVTNRDYSEQVTIYSQLAVDTAASNPSKLIDLIGRVDTLPESARDGLLRHLISSELTNLPEFERAPIWAQLAKVVRKHRKFADADWSMSRELLNQISTITDGLAPTSPSLLYRDLFVENEFDLYEEKGDYEAQAEALQARRAEAAHQIFATGGINSTLEFVQTVQSPWRVGYACGANLDDWESAATLPGLLNSDNESFAKFAGGFALGRFRKQSWNWIDSLHMQQWNVADTAKLLSYLPFSRETWKRAMEFLGDQEAEYWKIANVNPYAAENELETAIDRLLDFGRPFAAVNCLAKQYMDTKLIDCERAIRALDLASHSSESFGDLDIHHVSEILKALQSTNMGLSDELCRIEWAFLPALGKHNEVRPRCLEYRLASDPSFYCELIRLTFRPRSAKDAPAPDVDGIEKQRVERAYSLLNDWRVPPGSKGKGEFDGHAFKDWVRQMKMQSATDDRFAVALIMFGSMLVHAPADPTGLWIHKAIATELDAQDSEEMRNGFRTGLFNSRGTYSPTGGQEELKIAANYGAKADAVELAGFHRLAGCLRDLVTAYERDAKVAADDTDID